MKNNTIAEFYDVDNNMEVYIRKTPHSYAVSIKDIDSGNYLDVMYHCSHLNDAINRALELANLKPVKSTFDL